MKIAFCYSDTNAKAWLEGLRAALPQATVETWLPGADPNSGPAANADYAVVWAPPQQFLDEQPRLKALFNIGAGVDALMKLRLPDKLTVVRLEDAGMAVQMAEYVCHFLLRHVRQFDGFEADTRAGKWTQRRLENRSNFPVGIMGLGVLGQRVAKTVQHLEFPTLGWSRSPHAMDGVRCYHGADQLHYFLAATRVLVCLLPLTPDTRDVLCQDSLSRLQRGGYVINAARGPLLVDEDLIRLIDGGHLAGATLDVFRTEPLPPEHPFWAHPAINVTPHVSARTVHAESIAQIVGKIMAMERGERVGGVVDLKRGY